MRTLQIRSLLSKCLIVMLLATMTMSLTGCFYRHHVVDHSPRTRVEPEKPRHHKSAPYHAPSRGGHRR